MSEASKEARKTPLYDAHVAAGARVVDFAGWLMPVQYSGIKDEHLAVRNAAGLFDVCHMGEIEISGKDALAFIQYLTVNDASKDEIGAAQYTAFLNERGGIIDDLIFYRLDTDRYLLVVNAGNTPKDYAWIMKHAPKFSVKVDNQSDRTALLALQGPKSGGILASLADIDSGAVKRFHFAQCKVAGVSTIISRTGYTGEDGFEIFSDAKDAKTLWGSILEKGADQGLIPVGLGARDTLRLEMGYPLHGNDIDEDHTPLESSLGWICKLQKGDFIGRDVLLKQKEQGVKEQLIGMTFIDKGVPRHGYQVVDAGDKGQVLGVVTSGTMSPSLNIGIAMARIKSDWASLGAELAVLIREQAKKATVTRPPFYKKP